MKALNYLVVLLLCTYTACIPHQTSTDEAQTETSTSEVIDTLLMAENATNYMTPGPIHESMSKNDGRWDAVITFWAAPGGEPFSHTGVMENRMILNGLYQEGIYSGEMMGGLFEGRSITGYDNHLQKFVSTWIDNMGSGILFSTGTFDASTGKTTMMGKMTDPATGKEVNVKEVIWNVDDDHQEMEMYMIGEDGSEFKSMHARYTRAQK